MPTITVVIPHRMIEDTSITDASLKKQTFQDLAVIRVPDQGNGANWARNEGYKQVTTEFVIFSDNDITWMPNAFEKMLSTLRATSASFCWGRYKIGDSVWCDQHWNPQELKRHNYISTMALCRTADLPNPPFDEAIKRFQDWDLWLTMLKNGKRGVYCNDLTFTTEVRPGITHGGELAAEQWYNIVKKKHGIT